MNADTIKLWRLQSAEKFITKRLNSTSFEVFTKDLKLKAFIDVLGVIISSNCENYDKIKFYKLRNFSTLLQRVFFGL